MNGSVEDAGVAPAVQSRYCGNWGYARWLINYLHDETEEDVDRFTLFFLLAPFVGLRMEVWRMQLLLSGFDGYRRNWRLVSLLSDWVSTWVVDEDTSIPTILQELRTSRAQDDRGEWSDLSNWVSRRIVCSSPRLLYLLNCQMSYWRLSHNQLVVITRFHHLCSRIRVCLCVWGRLRWVGFRIRLSIQSESSIDFTTNS